MTIKKKLASIAVASVLSVGGLIALPTVDAQAWTGVCGFYTYHEADNQYTCTYVRNLVLHDGGILTPAPWATRGQRSIATACWVNEQDWFYERGY